MESVLWIFGAITLIFVVLHAFPSASSRAIIRLLTLLSGFRKSDVLVGSTVWPVLTKGRGDCTVVFVHGYGADKESWLTLARLLGNTRIIIPDLPGFGQSVIEPTADYSPKAQARRLAQFIDAIDCGPVHIVGSSMGGFISCWLAIEFPDRVCSLTLMNAAGVFGEKASPVQQEAEQGRNPLLAATPDDLQRLFGLLAYRMPPVPFFVRSHLLAQYRQRATHLQRVFDALVSAQQNDDLQTRLEGVRCPALILWGAEDRIIDVSCADVFDRKIADSQLVVLEQVGHIPMFEAPVRTAACLQRLIASV